MATADAVAPPPPPFDPTMQCETANILPMMLLVVLLYASAFVRSRGMMAGTALTIAIVALAYYSIVVRGIKNLTIAHLGVGSLGFEGAVRVARAPLLTVHTLPELFVILLFIWPNLMVTLSETCCPNDTTHFYFSTRSFEQYRHVRFFSKQHALLHFAITLLLASGGSSYWRRLRYSPRVQLARVFIEPACLVSVAMILVTHDHGASTTKGHEIATHPVIGMLMILAAICHTVTLAVHYAYSTANGNPADLTTRLPGGGPTPLRLLRLTTAFAYLLFACFLFVDTFFEYLGCRMILVKVGDEQDTGRIGWNPDTEVSTYKASAILMAVLTLAFVIVPLVGDGPAAVGVAKDDGAEESTELLPAILVQPSKGDLETDGATTRRERSPDPSDEGSA